MKAVTEKKILKVSYNKKESDLECHYPNQWDGNLMLRLLEVIKPELQELEKRGYDIKTLKIEIRKPQNHQITNKANLSFTSKADYNK